MRAILLLCLLLVRLPLPAAGPPDPSESVLVISSDATPYGTALANAYLAALAAISPAPTVNHVVVQAADIGIYGQLLAQTGQTSLSPWCQVWDLRFRDDKNAVGYTGPNQSDVLTSSGANNDEALYKAYLSEHGSLFLQAEYHDYYIRDLTVFSFLRQVALLPVNNGSSAQQYAGMNTMNTGAIGGFPSSPDAFNTSWNSIGAGVINAAFPGGLELAYAGSGRPIGAYFTSSYNSTGANQCNTAYAWLPQDLKTGGRLVVNFESNAFASPGTGSVAMEWIQNVYQLLSGCPRYSVTNSFDAAAYCAGDAGTYTICYQNLGATTLTNLGFWETLPACLSYAGDSLGASVNGQVCSWVLPSIMPGGTQCITVSFTIPTFACP